MAAYFSRSSNLMIDGIAYGSGSRSCRVGDIHCRTLDPIESEAFRLDLVLTLQKCLDPLALLNQLVEFLADYVPVQALAWEQKRTTISTGDFDSFPARTALPLTLQAKTLGTLQAAGKRALTDEECAWLNNLLEDVVYPLRNVCLYQQALNSAERDSLTGLKNRRAFDAAIEQELARYTRYGIRSTLIVVDLADFKAINDTWGHDVGDEVLIRVAEGLACAVRETDHVFRFGGDEFVIILPATNSYGARKFSARLTGWLGANPLLLRSGERVCPQVTIGYAETEGEDDATAWFRRADQELYGAKRQPRIDLLRVAN